MVARAKSQFTFENYGGSYQLRIRTASDLAALQQLDEPFWMATSAPAEQFTCDPVLLRRLDRDGTGRIQSCEVREAAEWLLRVLQDFSSIDERSDALDLSRLDSSHDEGRRLYDAAKRILRNLGDTEGARLSLTRLRDRKAIFSRGIHNGDGIIPPDGLDEDDLRAFVEDIMSTMGSVNDLNGRPGANQVLFEAFLESAQALLAWHDERGSALLPFGPDTPVRHELLMKLNASIDAYFEQCRVTALNDMLGRATEEATCPQTAFAGETHAREYLASAPIARPRPDGLLPLKEGINPHYAPGLRELAETVLKPIIGERFEGTAITEEEWKSVKDAFAAYERWLGSKSGGQVERLGLETLKRYVEGDLPQRFRELIEADRTAGQELSALEDLEFLVLLQRWLLDLCNNFVSFPHLYHPEKRAMFETGRLIMDGRIFNLNLKVENVDAHSAVATRSGLYILYSEVTGEDESDRFFIVTPITKGPLGNLGIGKRGVLFDLDGKEWDTRVVKVVENPVNLREAIAAPFKRLGGLVSSTTERITAGAEQQLETRITQAGTTFQTGIQEGMNSQAQQPAAETAAPAASASGLSRLRDVTLAGGVAVAALGSSFAYIASKLSELNTAYVLSALAIGLAIVVVLVLTPTVILAKLKLKRQNLSAVLEASGWAINAPMRLTRNLRRLIVQQPQHPRSFRLISRDLTRVFARTLRLKGSSETPKE